MAERVRIPLVRKVMEKFFDPFERVDGSGRIAFGSEEVIDTVPGKAVTIFWFASFAVMVKVNGAFAVEVAGTPLRTNWVAGPEVTVTGDPLESPDPEMLAVMLADPAVTPVKVEA
jgi:hypothetical protein